MNLEALKIANLEIAKDKGFGVVLSEVFVPEKIALIHSEVSEAYQAVEAKNLNGKHGLQEELADTFLRLLHLAGIFEVDLTGKELLELNLPEAINNQLLFLHNSISEIYENYRRKNLDNAKRELLNSLNVVFSISLSEKFNLEDEVKNKMAFNKNRIWNKNELNETIN